MYEVINEKLGIAKCSLEELTLKQVQQFLGQWEPEANIGELTLFYDKKEDLIVLNSSNKKYQTWLDIVEAYLIATGRDKEKLCEMMLKYSSDLVDILDNAIEHRANKQEMFRVKRSTVEEKYSGMIWQIWKDGGCAGPVLTLYNAFIYGMMCGKREERKKKRQSVKA